MFREQEFSADMARERARNTMGEHHCESAAAVTRIQEVAALRQVQFAEVRCFVLAVATFWSVTTRCLTHSHSPFLFALGVLRHIHRIAALCRTRYDQKNMNKSTIFILPPCTRKVPSW